MTRDNSPSDSEGRSLTPDYQNDTRTPLDIGQPAAHNYGATGQHDSMTQADPAKDSADNHAKERFKSSVRKVIQLNRMSSYLSSRSSLHDDTPHVIGAEPGIDPRKRSAIGQYGHIRQACTIDMVEYSSLRMSSQRMNNEEFVAWLGNEQASKRESWVKVRWIDIQGISWDVLSTLAIKFDLHPLALEDVLHQPRSAFLSKADYYARHLFLRVLCHTLADQCTEEDEEKSAEHGPVTYAANASYKNTSDGPTGLPRSSSPEAIEDTEAEIDAVETRNAYYNHQHIPTRNTLFPKKSGGDIESEHPTLINRINHRALTFKSKRRSNTTDEGSARRHARIQRKERLKNVRAIERLKGDHRVDVRIHPVCIFLLRTGTVISITRPSTDTLTDEDFADPIRTRLQHRDTSLRASADPSLLVHALLDLVVDHGFSIVDAYQSELLALEHQILLRTSMSAVRALHILEQDLNQHKRTLEPVRTVLYGLRRYDTDRAAALLDNESAAERARLQSQNTQGPNPDGPGFMSHKAKIYLADVYDHADYVIESLDMFASTAENLINYTFNMASYNMNDTMKRLTLATILFLPLTLLTGYFGMNFTRFDAINQYSDAFFWALGLPLVALVTVIFMWSDFQRMFEYCLRWLTEKRDTHAKPKSKPQRHRGRRGYTR